jgi:ABC-type nitrate/sulfonate/bicarbonate transport system permease component
LLGCWQAVDLLDVSTASRLPSLCDVAIGLLDEAKSGRLATDIVASLFRVSSGLLIATTLGALLGHSAAARASSRTRRTGLATRAWHRLTAT